MSSIRISRAVRLLIGAAFLLLSALWAFWPTYSGWFLLDDFKHFAFVRPYADAPWRVIEKFHPYAFRWHYRPMQHLFFVLMQKLAGYYAPAWYLVLLLVHVANSLLLYRLARRMALAPFAAASGSLLFAGMAIHQDVLGWISAIAIPMAAAFSLLALTATLPVPPRTAPASPALSTAALFFLLALFSREETITLLAPLVLLLMMPVAGQVTRATRICAGVISSMAALWLFFLFTRPTWTTLGDPSIPLSRTDAYTPDTLHRFFRAVLSRYVNLEMPQHGLFLVLLFCVAAVVLYQPLRRNRAARTAIVIGGIWSLALIGLLYLTVWPDNLLDNRYLYLPWMGVALAVAGVLHHFHPLPFLTARQTGAVITLLLAGNLLWQGQLARQRHVTWHDMVLQGESWRVQLQTQLPVLPDKAHLYAWRFPPAPDYIQAMAAVWYDQPLSPEGGAMQRLLQTGRATSADYLWDVEDGVLYNLMPELQEAAWSVFVCGESAELHIQAPDGSLVAADSGAWQFNLPAGPPDQRRLAHYLHPPAPDQGELVLSCPATVPEASRLVSALWRESGGTEAEDGIRYRLTLTDAAGNERELAAGTLSAAETGWHPLEIAMPSELWGTAVAFRLSLHAENNFLHDHFYWGNPRFVPLHSPQP